MEILKKELDPDQAEIAADISKNFLVLAGPGSGKTRIITHRIAYLYRNGFVTPPYRILGITFTNKAAAEMRGRLRQLSRDALMWSDIRTFHKFGEIIVRNYGYLVNIRKDFVIYDEKLQAIALKTAAKKQRLRLDAKGSVGVIENMKSEYGSISKAVQALRDSNQTQLAQLLENYEELLRERNAVDFADLLCVALELVQGYPILRQALQRMYKHVLVDECHDTNHVQLMLLQVLFSDSSTKVFGVADEDQSIYTWRGARIRNLNDFITIFGAEQKDLRRNYRCHPSILKVADSLILNAKNRLKTSDFIACRADDGECKAYRVDVPDTDAEGLFIADKIRELKDRKIIKKWSNVTVLGRTWGLLKPAAIGLNDAKIPNIIINEADIPDTPEVNVLLSALRSCANSDDELALDLVVESLGEAGHSNPTSFDPSRFIGENLSPIGILRKIRKDLELDSLLDQENFDERERRVAAMNSFERYCLKVIRIAPEISAFSRMLTLEGHADQSKEEIGENAVRLMAMHSSKGTENKIVVIVGLDEEIFPRFDIRLDSEKWEEERRLLYVSITRAEDYVFLVHSEIRPTAGTGTPRHRDPSPFLLEIDDSLLVYLEYTY